MVKVPTGRVEHGQDTDGVPYEDGRLRLADGRTLAWRQWGRPEDPAVIRLQGSVGSRLARGPNPLQAGVRLVMVDRPGFGHSTRLPGRGLSVVADDLTELLDGLGIVAAPVLALSAGGPHGLALAARRPDRVSSLVVVSGACPITPEERSGLVTVNAGLGSVLDRGWEALRDYLEPFAQQLASTGTASVVTDVPISDRRRRAASDRGRDLLNRREALRQGVAGWADETMAITGAWDFDLSVVTTEVRWWHGSEDNTVPLSAVRRLTAQLPNCELHVVHGSGHLLQTASLLTELAAGRGL